MRLPLPLLIAALITLVLATPPIISCDKPGSTPITNFTFALPATSNTTTPNTILTSAAWNIPTFDITCAQTNISTIPDSTRYLVDCTINTSVPFRSYLTFSDYPGLEDTLSTSFFLYTYCEPSWYKYSYQGIFKFQCEVRDGVKVCVPQDGTALGIVMYDKRKMLGPPDELGDGWGRMV